MSWTFKFFTDSELKDVFREIERTLNDLGFQDPEGNETAVSAKVAVSNRQDGDSIGVVFFNESIRVIPPPPKGQLQFSNNQEQTSGSDPTKVFEAIRDRLNDLNTTESFWAQLALADRKGGDTNAIIFWPESQDK